MIYRTLCLVAVKLCLIASAYGADKNQQPIPDLIKGEKLTRTNSGGIGPVGFKYNVWRPRQGTSEYERVRQLQVKSVDKGSPADGILIEGDVVVGANGSGAKPTLFDRHPERCLAADIDDAEARDPGTLNLLVWRPKDKAKPADGGETKTVTVTLRTLGAYSSTAPYGCPKSKAIVERGLATLLKEESPGQGGYNILCLLAGNDPDNPDHEKYRARAKEWAHQQKAATVAEVKGGAWQVGSMLISLAEYYAQTKDEEIRQTVECYAKRYANGQSWFGTTGHRWAERRPDGSPNGPMAGYGALNSSGLNGFLGMVLARKAGVKTPETAAAIERADTFYGCFGGRSGIGYGEHPWGIGGDGKSYDYNGHSGVAALAFSLQEKRQKKSRWFAMMSTAATSNDRVWCHAGPFFAQMYNPLGAGVGGPKAANHHFNEVRWHMTIHRNWDGSFLYTKGYGGWSRAATQMLFYSLQQRRIYLTGKGQPESLHFAEKEMAAQRITKAFDAKSMSVDELIGYLSGTFPADRRRAADELASRAAKPEDKADILSKLHAMSASRETDPMERAGACLALYKIKDTSSVKVLVDRLTDDDYYVRFVAASGLQWVPREAVMPHIDAILDVAATTVQPAFPLVKEDPLQFAHGAVAQLLFGNKWGLLKSSLKDVDRKKLWPAVRAVVKTPAGAARSSLQNLYKQLTREETLEIAEAIVEGARLKAPGDSMFAGHVREKGIGTLLKYSIVEGVSLSREQGYLNLLSKYGSMNKGMQSREELMEWLGDRQLVGGVDVSKMLEALASTPEAENPVLLKNIHSVTAEAPTLSLPAAKTRLQVDATNYGCTNEKDTTYTWRKVYGAGKVIFAPNASWQSKSTTVDFTDAKPGKYRFEVAMSDTLGYTVVRKTVDVTLLPKQGASLPRNRPPQATSQTLAVAPGIPLPITLSGTDPDGDDLGYVVTRQPVGGRLSGIGRELTYTPYLNFSGTETIAFQAIDGQAETAAGTVTIAVSASDVGVAVYEGFDYPAGPVNQHQGGASFGFNGPWKISRPDFKGYEVAEGSHSYANLPTTGGKLTKGKFWYFCSRNLDPDVLAKHKLLDNGQQLWFSVILGFPQKFHFSNFKFWFGLREDLEKTENDMGFAFFGADLVAAKNLKWAGGSRKWGEDTFRFPREAPHMIVAHCIWGKTDDEPDRVEIYRVFDAPGMGPIPLKEPISVMNVVIDQKKLNSIYCKGTPGILDEIRLGTTLQSVMLGTKPLKVAE